MLPNMKTDNPLSCAAHCDLAERDGGGGPGGAGGQAAHPHPGQRLLGPRQLQGAGGGQQGHTYHLHWHHAGRLRHRAAAAPGENKAEEVLQTLQGSPWRNCVFQ